MPIYEYRCTACGTEFEMIVRHGGRQPRTCRDCSGRLEKLISRTSFQLKGSGWYDDGYTPGKTASEKPAAKSEPKSGADSKAGAASKKKAKKAAASD